MTKFKPIVLVVDDEANVCESISFVLSDDFLVKYAIDAQQARDILDKEGVDLVLLDVGLPDINGLDFLAEIKESYSNLPVIILTADESSQSALRALRYGAYTYINKPYDVDELKSQVSRAVEHLGMMRELSCFKEQSKRDGMPVILGKSKAMHDVLELLEKVSRTDVTVLLSGESGTGKEVAAQAIHYASARAEHTFVAINCAAIPATLIESELFGYEQGAFTDASKQKIGVLECAHKGTLFLDEIAELRLDLQAKLLRFLETKTFRRVGGTKDISVDIRIVSASNIDLHQAVDQGTFRKDLYYRLNVVPVLIPALRDRADDIEILLNYFLNLYNKIFHKAVRQFSAAAIKALKTYSWPGNIRELRNIVERMVALAEGEVVLAEQLPMDITVESIVKTDIANQRPLKHAVLDFERSYIRSVLRFTKGNQVKAAGIMGIHRNALLNKMKTLGLK